MSARGEDMAAVWKHVQIAEALEQGDLAGAAEMLDPASKQQAQRIAPALLASLYTLGLEAGAITVGAPANFAEVVPYLIHIVRASRAGVAQ